MPTFPEESIRILSAPLEPKAKCSRPYMANTEKTLAAVSYSNIKLSNTPSLGREKLNAAPSVTASVNISETSAESPIRTPLFAES